MTIEMRKNFNAFILVHLGDEIRCGSDSKFARTLLLMGDAEKTLKSAHENCALHVLIFNECPIVTLTPNRGTAYPAGKFGVDG
jgi:hypothetical protein